MKFRQPVSRGLVPLMLAAFAVGHAYAAHAETQQVPPPPPPPEATAPAPMTMTAAQSAPTYTVGDKIAVRVGYLPKSSRKYVKEAVKLLNQYTTSNVVVRKWCGQVDTDWCLTIRPTTNSDDTVGGAAATHWGWRTRIHTDGHTESGWMGRVIYVQEWTLGASRAGQRGMFAHELGHAFTLKHHAVVNCDTYRGYDSAADVMGNNGQGSKKYFRVSWRTFNDQCETVPSNRAILRTV